MLSCLFSLFSYRSNNPYRSALYLILSWVLLCPCLGSVNSGWYIYVSLMVFLSGVFVAVLYICTLSGILYKKTGGMFIMMLIFSLLTFPWMFFSPLPFLSISTLFTGTGGLVLFILSLLVFLIVFVSYMLQYSGAMRTF